ncbi:MAG: hypothetical protein H7Z72_25650 [Bacteroidetes bacterium]|nr:hypothetical protein [Fibrella sp.]
MTNNEGPVGKIHIINHHVWPDGSPICLITEQTAQYLTDHQVPVVMVGSGGKYRPSSRPKPAIDLVTLQTKHIERQNVFQNIVEYALVLKTFWQYIRENVNENDTVVFSSAPPSNVLLRYAVRSRNVKKVFWLFDYFPGYLFPLGLPKFIYGGLRKWWDRELSKYDSVIKIAWNLGYFGENAVVHRQWPMIPIAPDPTIIPAKKALYTGNLGMGHDVDAVVRAFEDLRDQGYEINIHADGPGLEKLPPWLKERSKGIFKDSTSLIRALHDHEVHLVAGTPGIDELSFPSKTWNSIASGRRVIACGFSGKMQQELDMSLAADYKRHLPDLAAYLTNIHYWDATAGQPVPLT